MQWYYRPFNCASPAYVRRMSWRDSLRVCRRICRSCIISSFCSVSSHFGSNRLPGHRSPFASICAFQSATCFCSAKSSGEPGSYLFFIFNVPSASTTAQFISPTDHTSPPGHAHMTACSARPTVSADPGLNTALSRRRSSGVNYTTARSLHPATGP